MELKADANLRDELEGALLRAAESDVIVSRQTLRTALNRFLANELTGDDLVNWAKWVEAEVLSDRIDYETGYEKLLATTLFHIASPEINGALDAALCRSYVEQLPAND
jgi:hypothetical protein